MEQLTGLDARMLVLESATDHMHTLKVGVLECPAGTYSFECFKRALAERLPLLPPFRRRLVPLPLGVYHPVWIEDPAFDLDRHVSCRRVAPPGTMRELCLIASEVGSSRLDRSKPLWELVVVEGLAGGRVAFVAKIHHCVADGIAAEGLLRNAFGALEGSPAPGGADVWTPESVPSPARLFAYGIRHRIRSLGGLPRLGTVMIQAVRAALRVHPRGAARVPHLYQAPRTSMNGPLTSRRNFAVARLGLDAIHAVTTRLGTTVNDVVLAVVGGALRQHLADCGKLPAKPLLAGVPVATDAHGVRRISGNKVAQVIATLATDHDDPVERLRRVAASMQAARERLHVTDPDRFAVLAEYAPAGLHRAVLAFFAGPVARHWNPPINCIVSYVRGPTTPLAIAGATLREFYSVGPIVQGIGLNVTVWRYGDALFAGLLGCPDLVPDPWKVAAGLNAALDELVARARA